MPSEFDILAADLCSEFIAEQVGERDDNGDFIAIKYVMPSGAEHDLIGWSVSTLNGLEQIDETLMQVMNVETMTLIGPTEQLTEIGVKHYQRAAFVKIRDDFYQVDPLTTRIGGAMSMLGIKRKPMTTKNEMRHAGI